MSTEIQSKVFGWIDRALAARPGGEAQLTSLVLCHINAAEQLQPISSFPINGEDEDDIHTVKHELMRTAGDVAEAWRGLQRFAIQAYYDEGHQAANYFPFSLQCEDMTADAPGPTEPANLVGMLGQQMRHNEVLAKINAGVMAENHQILQRQLQRAHEEMGELRERHHTMLRDYEEALGQSHERRMVMQMMERGELRKDQIAAKLIDAVPPLANKVSQKLGGPKLLAENAGSSERQLVKDMLRSLNDVKLEALLKLFDNPLHQGAVLELVKEIIAEDKAAKEASAGADDQQDVKGANGAQN